MAAVGLSAEAADARLKKEGLGNTVVGCDNSAVNVTLAGKPPLACMQLPGAAHGASMRASFVPPMIPVSILFLQSSKALCRIKLCQLASIGQSP